MKIGQIYTMIKEKNQETGNSNAWVDLETNTIWLINDEFDELVRLYAENCTFKDMSEEEINETVQLALSRDWADEDEVKPLWFPTG